MAEAPRNQLPSGYDEDFVNVVEDDFECIICQLPLKEPVQTRCGHRFCKECLEEHFRRQGVQRQTCPADMDSLDRDKDVFPDKATERKILSLAIRCPSEGCDWTGELRSKEIHLASCLFKRVSCTNENCQVTAPRKDLEQHVTITCQWRIIKREHCSEPHPHCQMQNSPEVIEPRIGVHLTSSRDIMADECKGDTCDQMGQNSGQENRSPDKPEESVSHQENIGDNPPATINGSPTDKNHNPAVNNEKRNSEGGQLSWKDLATVGIVGGTAAVVAAPLALAAAGFTAGGVAAGSIAAVIQSSVFGGSVGATSAIAVLQGAGVAGIGMKTAAGIFTAGVGAAGVGALYLKSKLARLTRDQSAHRIKND